MAEIPAAFDDLMTSAKAFAHLATVSAGGAPQVTPVWLESRAARCGSTRPRGG